MSPGGRSQINKALKTVSGKKDDNVQVVRDG